MLLNNVIKIDLKYVNISFLRLVINMSLRLKIRVNIERKTPRSVLNRTTIGITSYRTTYSNILFSFKMFTIYLPSM